MVYFRKELQEVNCTSAAIRKGLITGGCLHACCACKSQDELEYSAGMAGAAYATGGREFSESWGLVRAAAQLAKP